MKQVYKKILIKLYIGFVNQHHKLLGMRCLSFSSALIELVFFFSDVTYLTSPPILATTEYSNLLRPLRGREPEGMWNLLQIVREMLARHDLNGTQLLDILTRQCLAQEQVKEKFSLKKKTNKFHNFSFFFVDNSMVVYNKSFQCL
jgi:hypothetical protein